MKKNRFGGSWATFFLAAGLFSTILISCKEDEADKVGQRTVTDIVNENPEFSMLKEILNKGGSPDAFRTQNATFFLPNNAAFQKAKITSAAEITSLPDKGPEIFLNSFVVESIYNVDNTLPTDSMKTASGKQIKFVKQGSAVNVNNAEITRKNVPAANGIIQVIDSVYVKMK